MHVGRPAGVLPDRRGNRAPSPRLTGAATTMQPRATESYPSCYRPVANAVAPPFAVVRTVGACSPTRRAGVRPCNPAEPRDAAPWWSKPERVRAALRPPRRA